MKLTFTDLIRPQYRTIPAVETANLSGRNVVVIGGNTGIGFEAAKHFARMNPARIILGCRNEIKGRAAISIIEKETGYTKLELWLIDLSKFSSVIEFADKFEQDCGRLDLLIMNAGIVAFNYEVTPDKWESTLQVNHLATSLLSLLLIPSMLKTAQHTSATPRIVIVSSSVHHKSKFTEEEQESPNLLEKLNNQEYCSYPVMRRRYVDSKCLNVFFTRALNSHIAPSTPLIVNAVNPGYCYSELRRSLPIISKAGHWLMEKAMAITAEQGSRELVFAAVSGGDESRMRGAYVSEDQIKEVSDFVLSEEGARVQDRIWVETTEILSRVSPKVKDIVANHLC